jgi:hypothetical protein
MIATHSSSFASSVFLPSFIADGRLGSLTVCLLLPTLLACRAVPVKLHTWLSTYALA